MQDLLNSLRQMLFELHPLAPWLALAIVPFCLTYLTRKALPDLWLWLELWGPDNARASRVFLALPAVITTAALAAIGAGYDPWVFVKAALAASFSPLLHHALKASPLPYKGELGDPKLPPPGMGGALFILALFVAGCGGTRTPAEELDRQGCLLKAEWSADKRAIAECPDTWSTCVHRADIMAELKREQEKCR